MLLLYYYGWKLYSVELYFSYLSWCEMSLVKGKSKGSSFTSFTLVHGLSTFNSREILNKEAQHDIGIFGMPDIYVRNQRDTRYFGENINRICDISTDIPRYRVGNL